MDWNTIEKQISADDQNKWDRQAAGEKLRIVESGALAVANGHGEPVHYALSDHAISQFCQRLEIPVPYYRRLPGAMKATVANYDIGRLKEKSYLLRGKGDWIRAFLSSDYTPYDNKKIAETVQSLLSNGAISIKDFVLEETNLYLKLVSEEIADHSSSLKAGIMIGNSEVGLGSVSVEPFVFRKPCTNDLVVAQEKSFRHAHIHFTAHELNRRMAEGISHAFEVATTILDAFLKTQQDPVPDPLEVIRKIAEERQMSQKFTDQVVSGYLVEPEPTRFGVINAFTRAAQGLAPIQRIEMERFAGTLLEAPLAS
jgi:hypothetical protein